MRPEIVAAYRQETPGSASRFSSMERVMPGGNTRAAAFFAPYPVVLARGQGCEVEDVDGNRYLDLLSNYTSLIHGHRHPVIEEAIREAMESGLVFPSPTAWQERLAGMMCERYPSVEQVRFTSSGTEGVMGAVRAARAFTGRDRIVTIKGGYHGSWDQVSVALEVDGTSGRPVRWANRGIPAAVRDLVVPVRYNDVAELETAFDRHGGEMAALIMEPVIGEQTIPAEREFLDAARRLTSEHGALLIFDEVVTARLAHGGVQSVCGVIPDLTAFGKTIGGGLPVGAFGGRAEVMAVFDTRVPDAVPHHGTYNGNNLTMAAGLASLGLLTADEIARINSLGDRLAAGLGAVFADGGHPFRVSQVGSLLLVEADRGEDLADLHLSALLSGVYMAPRGLMCISTPMDEAVVDEVVERMTEAVGRLAG
ncbi:MAG: aminotransferase class III-fold pyridoxal phosphate-dependent enzyme [Actinomycetes bacterium]|jgi:glutamate-1-semialdehyde 2,1-aminomutase